MNKIKLEMKTLTPIWTGGANKLCDRINESAIIGSIRWWYEAIVRGLGGYACDPTTKACPKENGDTKEWCNACKIFGATGRSRSFSLHMINDGEKVYDQKEPGQNINIRPIDRSNGWFYGAGRSGYPIDIEIVPLRKINLKSHIFPILSLINRWAAIGSRTQHGFGVIDLHEIKDGNKIPFHYSDVLSIPDGTRKDRDLPNIKDFFFARFKFQPDREDWYKDVDGLAATMNKHKVTLGNKKVDDYKNRLNMWIKSNSVPVSPAIRNWLRYKVFNDGSINRGYQDIIFGKVSGNNKIGSKISISAAYKNNSDWEFRIWGWVPPGTGNYATNRDAFLDKLKDALTGSRQTELQTLLGCSKQVDVCWKAFDNSQGDIKTYLTGLLEA